MGKILIINGADFTLNAIGKTEVAIDISNLFDTDAGIGMLVVQNEAGEMIEKASISGTAGGVVKHSNKVDISAYAGKKIKISNTVWASSLNALPFWGTGFFANDPDSDMTLCGYIGCKMSTSGASTGGMETVEYTIPSNAKYVIVSWFNPESTSGGSEISIPLADKFSCVVIN